jgi:hypothetical protein
MRTFTTADILPLGIVATVVIVVVYNIIRLGRDLFGHGFKVEPPRGRQSDLDAPVQRKRDAGAVAATFRSAPVDVASAAPAPPRDLGRAKLDRSAPLRAIAFRRPFPPTDADRASTLFFGGLPRAPSGFAWPRRSDGRALTFIAQIDCARLPAASEVPDRALLPENGALLFFVDMNGDRWLNDTQYVHYVPAGTWTAAEPPVDLVPFVGPENAAYVERWANGSDTDGHRFSRASRRFAMEPVPLDTAPLAPEDENEWDTWYERTQAEAAAALDAAFGPPILAAGRAKPAGYPGLWRPFDAFPHSRRALRTIAGSLAYDIDRTMEKADEDDRPKLDEARDEAVRWRDARAEEPLETALDQPERDEFWAWLEMLHGAEMKLSRTRDFRIALGILVDQTADETVQISVAEGGASAQLIPPVVLDRLASHHAKRWTLESGSVTQHSYDHQLLGHPMIIQDPPEAEDHRLLAQFTYDSGLGWYFGDVGAYQYWLKPEDLAAGRWGKARLTFESH